MGTVSERVAVAEAGEVALVEPAEGDRESLRERHERVFECDLDDREPLYVPEVHTLGVVVGGELIGSVSWHATGYGEAFSCSAWNIGIALLASARGRGHGPAALRMLIDYLFATTEVDRIEAETDVENRAAQRALARAGMRSEGVLRGAHVRGGVRRDMVAYGLLRADTVRPQPDAERTVVAERDGVALAEPVDGERERLFAEAGGEFDVDRDDRPRVAPASVGSLLTVLDAASRAVLGGVTWHAVDYGGTLGCSAWNIGIGLLPSARGRGVGAVAQRLLAEHLFATTPLDRVEAGTDVANVAEQKALVRAGFRREGVIRGAQLRGGERHDLVQYGLLRADLVPPGGERKILAERDGVAIAWAWPGELERVFDEDDGAFAVDPDPRPRPSQPGAMWRAAVLESGTGTLLGSINWWTQDWGGTLGCAAWRFGIALRPAARGRGVGATVQRLLADHLFATTELDRVEAGTDVDNVAERRALAKAGFREDGTIRGAQLRGGRRTDVVLYSRLRTDE
jgi:RimJ/RimL family protein N-acetyltransferase